MRTHRQGIIVWFQQMKNLKQLRKHGHLIYASRKMKYAVIYTNLEDIAAVENRIRQYPFVKKIERSQKPFINTNFENAKLDKAKQYDYKIGI